MSRLKELLRVATPSTRNAQQLSVEKILDVNGNKSESLLHVAFTSPYNTQQELLCRCKLVAQHTHTLQQEDTSKLEQADINDFERLLEFVAPLYFTPAHEYAEIREAARHDLSAAMECYGALAEKNEEKADHF